MSLNWDDLRIVLAVARAGSLSKAAVVLGIDQSTAGRRLSALEGDLGAILFVRAKTGFTLTEAGQAVVAHAVEVERRVGRISDDLAAVGAAPVGVLRLIGNAWTLKRLAGTALPKLLTANPRLDVRLIHVPPQVPHRTEPAISLWFEARPHAGEFSIKLGQVPYAVYRKRGVEPDPPHWVTFFDEDNPRRAPVRAWERLRGKEDRQRLTTTDAEINLSGVKAGVGRALLPMCLAEGDADLMRVGDGPPELERTLHLHAHPDTVQSQRVQVTIRWLRESFAEAFLPPDVAPGG